MCRTYWIDFVFLLVIEISQYRGLPVSFVVQFTVNVAVPENPIHTLCVSDPMLPVSETQARLLTHSGKAAVVFHNDPSFSRVQVP